jgi:hypothetical protein
MFNNNYSYGKNLFSYMDAGRVVSDYLQQRGTMVGIYELVNNFINSEYENATEVFDMPRFSSFLYTKAAEHHTGNRLSLIDLEEPVYRPKWIVENTVQNKKKYEEAQESASTQPQQQPEGNTRIDSLENGMSELRAMFSQLMSTSQTPVNVVAPVTAVASVPVIEQMLQEVRAEMPVETPVVVEPPVVQPVIVETPPVIEEIVLPTPTIIETKPSHQKSRVGKSRTYRPKTTTTNDESGDA